MTTTNEPLTQEEALDIQRQEANEQIEEINEASKKAAQEQ